MTTMNDLIRRAVGVRQHAWSARRETATAADDLGEYLTPDDDQGRRNGYVHSSASMEINDRIRRAGGISVRPGHKPVPEIGDY